MSTTGIGPDLAGKAAGGRKLIAVVYADMVGYSRLIDLDDAGTLWRLRTLRRALIDPAIREHGGRVAQTGGDSLLIAFDSIDGAVRCAVKVQQQVPVYDGDQPPDRRIRFRIGINIGDVIPDGTDLHGDGVNIAARLEAASPVGGICVSRTVKDHVHGRLDLAFEPIGELTLKNIARPVEAFVLRLDPTADAIELPQSALKPAVPQEVGSHGAPRLSLVVLPFANLTGDGVPDYIVDGITEDLIIEMSHFPGLQVIGGNSAFADKARPVDIRRIGAELAVRAAVEGSVRRTATGALRINVQLASTAAGTQFWADRFDVGADGSGQDIDTTVRSISWALYQRIIEAEEVRSTRERPDTPDAIDALLRAQARRNLQPIPETTAQAVAFFERAVELNPLSAEVLAGLAETLIDSVYWTGIFGSDEDPTADPKLRRAEALLTRAELLRPVDLKVMWTRLYLLGTRRWDAELIEAAQRMIETHPGSGGAHLYRGLGLMRAGKATDAIREFEQSIRIHPSNPGIFTRYLQWVSR